MGTTAPHGTCRQAAARLGCLGRRPRSPQRHGPHRHGLHRHGPIHGPRLHRPHRPASRSSASRSSRTSSCSSPASPARASTASGAPGRDAHWGPGAPMHPAVHCAPRPVASAATGPSARAVHTKRPLPPFQPSLSRRLVCHRHVLAPYHPSNPLSHPPSLRPSGREARSRLPTREPREPYTSRTTTRSSARRVGGAKTKGALARYS